MTGKSAQAIFENVAANIILQLKALARSVQQGSDGRQSHQFRMRHARTERFCLGTNFRKDGMQ